MLLVRRLGPLLPVLLLACAESSDPPAAPPRDPIEVARERMIEEQVKRMAGEDSVVIQAFRAVPRHAFLPREMWNEAYEDRALRRPDGETLTAPDLTAAILATLELTEDSRVLECGTRSGWLTALLATIGGEVFTVDARPQPSEQAAFRLRELGFDNISYRIGDPLRGWPEEAPFDAIVINGVVEHIPEPLYRLLTPGGRILAPIGRVGESQSLILAVKGDKAPRETKAVLTVRFGPLAR